jgi:hypothetical protein
MNKRPKFTTFIISIFCFITSAVLPYTISGSRLFQPNWNLIVDLQLDTGDPNLYLLHPDDSSSVSVNATNISNTIIRGELVAEIRSFDEDITRISEKLVLKPGEKGNVTISAKELGSLGIKWVQASWSVGGNVRFKKDMAFAIMEPAGNENALDQELIMAIAYGSGPDHESEWAAKAAGRVGLGMYRAPMYWNSPVPDFEDNFRKIRVQQKYGIQPYILVNGTAPFAELPVDGYSGRNAPPEPEAWRIWVRQLANAIKDELPGQKVLWEIWNEPDIQFFRGTTDQYIKMLKIAWHEIKDVDSENFVVMTGGFASMAHPQRKEDMVRRIVTEEQDYWEFVAFHQHGVFPNFVRGIEDHLRPILDKAGKPAPVFLTETGMDTRFGEHYQATELIKKIIYSWSQEFIAYTWFSLHDRPHAENPTQPGTTYGLYTKNIRGNNTTGDEDYSNSYPKASYVAMNTLNTVMNGVAFHKKHEIQENKYVYSFKSPDRMVIVVWDQDGTGSSHMHLIETDAVWAENVDIMGNARNVPLVDGFAPLEINRIPSFLVLHQATGNIEMSSAIIDGLELSGSIEVPHNFNAISITSGFGDQPDLILGRQDQVVNRYEHDPHTVHLLWQDKSDKSAEVRFAREQGRLKIRMEIRDDYHHVVPDNLTEGDCAIISLYVPEQKAVWRWAVSNFAGKGLIELLSEPADFDSGYTPAVRAGSEGKVLIYEIIVDEDKTGIDWEHNAMRINMTLVDHDGDDEGIKSYIYLSQEVDTNRWPYLLLTK